MSAPSITIQKRNIIYQVHCGRWEQANVITHPGNVLQQLLKFNWKRLKETIGITHVYLLGLWENEGKIIVNEEAGVDLSTHPYRSPSPFAITNHNVINPDLGTTIDMDRLLTCLHALDIAVLADFVPNHTGLSHPWIAEHPEYYKHANTGTVLTGFSGDVAELNYENSDLRREMINVLRNIASFGFDGVRCDMAHLIPLSFWSEAIEQVHKQSPLFCWIGEAYSSSVFDLSIQTALMRVGFDAIYDEPLYRNLKTTELSERVSHFMGHFNYVQNNTPAKWVHYVSNHDDNFPLPPDQCSIWFKLISLLPGWLLIYNGSLWGRVVRLAHHWVELLPLEQTLPEALEEDYRSWFAWLIDEQPQITKVVVTSLIEISWRGAHKRGLITFNLTNESQVLSHSTDRLDPYQVLVQTL